MSLENREYKDRAYEKWTKEEEKEIISIVNEHGIYPGLHRAALEMGRSYEAIKQRFTITRLFCERAIHLISEGKILRGFDVISNFRRGTFYPNGLFYFHLQKTLDRYDMENIFSQKVLAKEIKNTMKRSGKSGRNIRIPVRPSRRARKCKNKSRLLIDKDEMSKM